VARVVELEIPARADYLALVRLVVGAVAAFEPDLVDERIDDLRLVVSEAATNAIEVHGGDASGANDRICIRCTVTDDALQVDVADRGPGFDPDDLSSHPPVTDPSRLEHERGLGIPLIRLLTDGVSFKPSPEGTTVSMVFRADELLSSNGSTAALTDDDLT
jgi:serine/threonine-protein kinase RsbW